MKIRIRRKKLPEWLLLYIWIMPFALPFLLELLHLPSIIKYTLDVAWIILLFAMEINRIRIPNVQVNTLIKIVTLFFGISIIGFLMNYQSILYYLWGFRNNFRFYVFFLACILYLSPTSSEKCLSSIDTFFWINFPLVLLQYFVLHKKQDFVGGIFGTQAGCNGYLNIFLSIVVTKSILYFLNKKEKQSVCLMKCCAALIAAVLSELKIFFIEFLLIIFLIMFLSKFSVRKFTVITLCAVGIVIGAKMISVLFPDFSGWFSIDGILKIIGSERGYTSRNDMNRLNAVAYAMDNFLPSFKDKIIGLGLGNCDYATFDFLTTPFHRVYGWTNYGWFSSAFLILETGFAGLIAYISFFVVLYFGADKLEKTAQANMLYCQLARVMAVLSVLMVIYNAALRTEAAYMMYFVLSLPFIKHQNTNAVSA